MDLLYKNAFLKSNDIRFLFALSVFFYYLKLIGSKRQIDVNFKRPIRKEENL